MLKKIKPDLFQQCHERPLVNFTMKTFFIRINFFFAALVVTK